MKVIDADRLDGAVVITFEDGTTFVYSAELLYGMRLNAEAATCHYEQEADDA